MFDVLDAIAKAVYDRVAALDQSGTPEADRVSVQLVDDPWEDNPSVNLARARVDIGPGTGTETKAGGRKGNTAGEHRVFIVLRQFMEVPTIARRKQLGDWLSDAVRLITTSREALVIVSDRAAAATFLQAQYSHNLQHRRDKRVLSFFVELQFMTHE